MFKKKIFFYQAIYSTSRIAEAGTYRNIVKAKEETLQTTNHIITQNQL
jgi:hypothetical protein